MIKNKLVLSALILSSLYSVQSSASVFHIDEMNIASGTITRNFKTVPDTIALNLNSNTNLIGGYINKDTGGAISETNFNGAGPNPMAPTQNVYTAASNINHNNHSMAPASGTHLGGPVPSGTVDDVSGTITMDLSSWFANHGKMDQNLGAASATGTWDAMTGAYDLSWTAFLTQGPGAMNPLASVTWNLQGNVVETSPVPVPGAVWLMGTALFGLQRLRRKAVATEA